MTKCPGEGICMTIIIVICAEVVIMVFRVTVREAECKPQMLSVGYAGAHRSAPPATQNGRPPHLGGRPSHAFGKRAVRIG